MKLKSSLLDIALHYIPGCVDFYSKLTPDPWQAEHIRLESMMSIGNEVDVKIAIDDFEKNIKLLIKRYRK
jgi:hypothetical protein